MIKTWEEAEKSYKELKAFYKHYIVQHVKQAKGLRPLAVLIETNHASIISSLKRDGLPSMRKLAIKIKEKLDADQQKI